MEAKDVFDKIRQVKSLESLLKDTKPKFGDLDFERYARLNKDLKDYCKNFSIADLFELYSQSENEKQFAVQYNLLMQSDC